MEKLWKNAEPETVRTNTSSIFRSVKAKLKRLAVHQRLVDHETKLATYHAFDDSQCNLINGPPLPPPPLLPHQIDYSEKPTKANSIAKNHNPIEQELLPIYHPQHQLLLEEMKHCCRK